MKKMIKAVLVLICFVSFHSFTETESYVHSDIIKNRLEQQYKTLNDGKRKLKIKDYNVDISDEIIKLKIQTRRNIKNFDYDKAIEPLKEIILGETKNFKNINIIIEVDSWVGNDKIVYDRTFSQGITLSQTIDFVGDRNFKIRLVTNDNWETAQLMDDSEIVYALKRVQSANGIKLTNDSGVSIYFKNGEGILIFNNGNEIKVREVNK